LREEFLATRSRPPPVATPSSANHALGRYCVTLVPFTTRSSFSPAGFPFLQTLVLTVRGVHTCSLFLLGRFFSLPKSGRRLFRPLSFSSPPSTRPAPLLFSSIDGSRGLVVGGSASCFDFAHFLHPEPDPFSIFFSVSLICSPPSLSSRIPRSLGFLVPCSPV